MMGKKHGRVKKAQWCVIIGLLLGLWMFTGYGSLTAYAYENTIGIITSDDGARIRSTASTDSSVLASVPKDSRVEICGTEIGQDGYTWYKIYVNGNSIGYIRSDLMTDTGEKTGSTTDNNATGNVGTQPSGGDNGNGENTDPGDDQLGQEGDGSGSETVDPNTGAGQGGESGVTGIAGSSDAMLRSIYIGDGSLSPAFSPNVTQYTLTLDENVSSVAVFGEAAEGAVVIENYGFSNLEHGSNMAIITVQAQDGTRLSYSFVVNRGAASEQMHYSQPTQVGESSGSGTAVVSTEKSSSHTGLIVFLIIILLAMAAVMVLMGLRIRDYRRDLYGEDPDEFHLRDALPENSVFSRNKAGGGRSASTENRKQSSGGRTVSERGIDTQSMSEKRKTVYPAVDHNSLQEQSASESLDYGSLQTGDAGGSFMMEDGFLYDMKQGAQTTEPDYDDDDADGQAYGGSEENEQADALREALTAGEDGLEEDELEDIMERNATITDNQSGKEVWKSVNFMTPSEELEFEFLDIEDENE